jgi:carboxy-terminal domain RNA polymerase II polypeptide A small phosphatase
LKTLILDLDETLVHSSFKPHGTRQADITLPVVIDGKECKIFVLVRPGALEFCELMCKFYEVIVFTASLSKYAEPLVKELDPSGSWCSHILFREHCTFMEDQEAYVKDLSKVGRPLKDVIIIDNSPTSYFYHPENALASRSWYDDYEDRELYDFIPLLQKISNVEDVRPVLSRIALEACDRDGRDIIVQTEIAMQII